MAFFVEEVLMKIFDRNVFDGRNRKQFRKKINAFICRDANAVFSRSYMLAGFRVDQLKWARVKCTKANLTYFMN